MATSPPAPLKPNALGRRGFLSLTNYRFRAGSSALRVKRGDGQARGQVRDRSDPRRGHLRKVRRVRPGGWSRLDHKSCCTATLAIPLAEPAAVASTGRLRVQEQQQSR
eukprot:scaffold2765_cov128-Isochrysis_galbana.AAC.10